jgi:hypothetical protein
MDGISTRIAFLLKYFKTKIKQFGTTTKEVEAIKR